MDGSLGPAAQAARDWAGALSEATGLPAAMWDERLSSAAANRVLIADADLSRAKRAAAVDRLAAAWLLQAALDAGEGRKARGRCPLDPHQGHSPWNPSLGSEREGEARRAGRPGWRGAAGRERGLPLPATQAARPAAPPPPARNPPRGPGD